MNQQTKKQHSSQDLQKSKKVKPNEEPKKKQSTMGKKAIVTNQQIPQNIMVKFLNSSQESLGTFQVSTTSGPKQFQELIDKILAQKDQDQQFNFFHHTKQIKNSLKTFFTQIGFMKYQETLEINYYPVSNFKVKPITRSSSSMYGHTEAVLSMSFNPNPLDSNKKLASGSGDGTVRFWDVHTQTLIKELQTDNWVMIVMWSPDGQKLAFGQKNGNVTVYKWKQTIEKTSQQKFEQAMQKGQKIQIQQNKQKDNTTKMRGHTKWITSLAWQPLHLNQNCNMLISASKDFTIRMWNTDDGSCLRSFGGHIKCVTKVLWSGADQIYSCSEDQKISVFDNKGNHLREMKKHSHWVNTMALSTEHVLRRGCFEPGNFEQVKVQQRQQKALKLYEKAVQSHGERLVTGSDDFTLYLFYLPQKTPKKHMLGHQQPVNHVQFSPDGRYIISASFDKSIKLWDGFTGDYMYTFRGHVGSVYQVAWSSDSRYLVSGSKDSTLKVWDIKTRKLMFDLPGHADEVYSVDWSLDGEMVASGGKDRQVKLWRN